MGFERALEQLQRTLNANADLTTKQIRAFLMISKASIEGDPLTTEDVRRFLNLSSQCAHNTVCAFVDQGFVTRVTATFDGRAKHLLLTNTGRVIVDQLVIASTPSIHTTKETNVKLLEELMHG